MGKRQLNGAQYLIEGFTMLKQPGLKRYLVIPFVVNIILFALLTWLGMHWFGKLLHSFDQMLPHWLQWLNWLIWPLFFLAVLAIFFYLFSIVTNIIGAPFNGLLAEKVQKLQTGQELESSSYKDLVMKELPRAMKRQWLMIKYFVPRGIICLILFFIPVVQTVAPIIWFVFCAWMLTIQYLDYPMDNNKISFPDMLKQLKSQCTLSLTFGLLAMLLTMIPVVNFVVMPAAVVGGTRMWLEHFK